MDRLPPEVLCHIFEYSTWCHKDDDTPDPDHPTVANLKALRLCCRYFAENGAKYLFSQLWVYMTDTSFVKMRMVAEHPKYSRMVRELKVFPRLLTKFHGRNEYERRVRSRLNYIEKMENHDIEISDSLFTREMDTAYARFTEIWNQQLELLGNVEGRLFTALNHLTQLRSLTSGIWQEFALSELRRTTSTDTITRRTRLLLVPGQCREHLHHPDDAMSIIRAAACCRPALTGVLRGLGIFKSFMADFMNSSPEDLELVRRLVTYSTYLDLTVDSVHLIVYKDLVTLGKYRRLLEWSNRNLEKLSVDDSMKVAFVPVFANVFGTIHWPRLRKLTLKGFSVHGDELSAFLQRHKKTLTNLRLLDITLQSASWRKVFTQLRGGALTSVAFRKLGVIGKEETFDGCDCGDYVSRESLREGLRSFIIGEQPWPSKVLPAILSRDVGDTEGHSDEAA